MKIGLFSFYNPYPNYPLTLFNFVIRNLYVIMVSINPKGDRMGYIGFAIIHTSIWGSIILGSIIFFFMSKKFWTNNPHEIKEIKKYYLLKILV